MFNLKEQEEWKFITDQDKLTRALALLSINEKPELISLDQCTWFNK